MKCNKCGNELEDKANYCSVCGTRKNGQTSFYNWIAFISYSHTDWETARFVECELKKYKIPLIICSHNPELISVKFDQIFRDENNFGNGTLDEQVEFGLMNSKYLISICSPNYAKLKDNCTSWCNEEIKRFYKYHNEDADSIIPLIIEGAPHSKNECFPPSLLNLSDNENEEKEIIGIDGTKIRTLLNGETEKQNLTAEEKAIKDEIFDALKARLLGLNYGAYRKYAHQEKYFKDYVDRNAIPLGICELTNGDWEKTPHYKFVFREDLLYEVRYENGNGTLIPHFEQDEADKIIDSIFHYDEKGNLLNIEDRDRYGNTICIKEFKKNYCVINFCDKNENSKLYAGSFFTPEDDGFNAGNKKSNIRSIHLVRDENGFVIKESFHKYHNEFFPVSNNDGFYAIEYERNSNGLITKKWYLDRDGKRCKSKYGSAGINYEYDKNGFKIKEIWVDENRNPVINLNGYAIRTIKYDPVGNVLERTFYDENNKSIENNEGNNRVKKEYDKNGNCVKTVFFGTYDLGYSKYECTYDDKGNLTEIKYFDPNGNLCSTALGNAIRRSKFDENNNEIERSFYGTNGEPIIVDSGYSKWQKKYDKRGFAIETSYFGIDDRFVLISDGYAKRTAKHDEEGNGTELAYFGLNGEKVLFHGYAKGCAKFDNFGNCIETAFFGLNDEPVLNPAKRHMWKAKYDERGNKIEETSYGINGEPILTKNGYFKWQKFYDENGNCKLTIYSDIEDNEIERK
ncbi:MAG: TIR domain-containing protein [Treponema sp.]|nr:TIR domain-containing protein [Candidatus Treponema equifaecale]